MRCLSILSARLRRGPDAGEACALNGPGLTTTVNEQNEQAVGFYKKVGLRLRDALRWTIWGNRIRY